jgi:hypothetical protein
MTCTSNLRDTVRIGHPADQALVSGTDLAQRRGQLVTDPDRPIGASLGLDNVGGQLPLGNVLFLGKALASVVDLPDGLLNLDVWLKPVE